LNFFCSDLVLYFLHGTCVVGVCRLIFLLEKKEIVVVYLGRVIIINNLSFFFQFYMKYFRKPLVNEQPLKPVPSRPTRERSMTIWPRPRTSRRSSRIHLRKSVYKPRIISGDGGNASKYQVLERVGETMSKHVKSHEHNQCYIDHDWVDPSLSWHWRRVQLRRLEPLQLAWAKH
jgi:hypothetical protein